MIQMHLLCSNTKILIITTQIEIKKDKKVLIVFDDIIANIITNKKFLAITKELLIRCKKLNISLAFITQSYFSVSKDVRLNSTHCLIMKTNSNR